MSARIDELTQFVDTNGRPFVGGFVYIGVNGLDPVLNPITIFSDRELTTPLANPQTLDSFGRSANKIWIPGKYSMKVEDVDNVQVLQDLDAGSLAEVGNTILTDVLGANTITANAVNTITSLVDGQTYILTIASNNTGPVTLNTDNTGARPVRKNYTEELISDDFVATFEAVVVYNGDNDIYQWVNRINEEFVPPVAPMVLLETIEISTGVTEVDFENFAAHDNYLIKISGVQVSIGNDINLRFGIGVGPTYDTSNIYEYFINISGSGDAGVFTGVGSNPTNLIRVLEDVPANARSSGYTDIYFANLSSTSLNKLVTGQGVTSNGGEAITSNVSGVWDNFTDAVTGIRLLVVSGNMTAGKFKLYGLN